VDASLAAARLAIFAENSDDIEWGTPVLFMRVADGRIFDVPEPAVALPKALASEPLVAAPVPEDAVEQPTVRPVAPPIPAESSAPAGVRAADIPRPAAPRAPKPPGAPHDRYRRLLTLGAVAVSLAAVVAVLILVISGGGGESANDVVKRYLSAYNQGDDRTAAGLWSPSIGITATYRPGSPASASTQFLQTPEAVTKMLFRGCQRTRDSTTVAKNVVTVSYWSFGQRPGNHDQCRAPHQHWKDVFTVTDEHITSDVSTSLP
jgi:hypothetical protein